LNSFYLNICLKEELYKPPLGGFFNGEFLVSPTGIEPVTYALGGRLKAFNNQQVIEITQ